MVYMEATTPTAARIRPWEVQPGDRVQGTTLVATGEVRYSEAAIGGDVERQRYRVVLTDGRAIPYGGDSWLTVIRNG